ncbi:hypothetical protein Kpol_1054p11 [Vanderwaltozyma polyspora DSM 70294]|uniref:WSC domain-containing protein n=1 Tax=Vanderwaltozyma polyspora (strain ATCC 22028 / DSM 70294 / BCRC 21397 / CBS 2163 / NBRC 10782 / NRRL Y-8283 / UCD 57-17) TaxID=436907 RepID=A7TI99_VANPO|nr:uncharacterized protein Kpol_1054p11 [Vanderwaltozyma polyspora DSM 70294]EDO17965.1 hypothetical protein Kpol_1054p11 [Vanderwaltozyma polyspora DSM 70294]
MLVPLVIHLWFLSLVSAAYSYKGCYSSTSLESSGLTSKGTYEYQSVSYCQQQCSGFPLVALLNGGECFCGDSTSILDSLSSDSSQCTVSCNGWPFQTCGGQNYMDVYVDPSLDGGSSVAISSSSSSSTTTTSSRSTSSSIYSPFPSNLDSMDSSIGILTAQSSTTSIILSTSDPSYAESTELEETTTSKSTKSASSATVTSSSRSSYSRSTSSRSSSSKSSSSTALSTIFTSIRYTTQMVTTSVVTGSDNVQQTVFVTRTAVLTTSSSVATSGPDDISTNGKGTSSGKSSNLSGGAIAGIVVGVVAGTIIILLIIIFFYWRRRREHDNVDLEQTKQHQPYSFGDVDANPVVAPERVVSSKWRKPSRNNTHLSNDSDSSSKFIGLPNSSSSNNINDDSFNSGSVDSGPNLLHRPHYPSTVFEEDPQIYNGNQRFSTTSLPDMKDDRPPLRIVNPDEEKIEEDMERFMDTESSES